MHAFPHIWVSLNVYKTAASTTTVPIKRISHGSNIAMHLRLHSLFSIHRFGSLALRFFHARTHVFLNTRKAETESALGMNLMILFKIIIISSNYVIIISVKMNVLLHNNAATPITPPLFNSLAHSIVIVIAVIHYFCIFGCACIRFSLHIRNANIVQLIVIIASIAWKSA